MTSATAACTRVETEAECNQAAVFLGLSDTTSDDSRGGPSIPPYCSYDVVGSILLFHDKTGKEECQKCNIDLRRMSCFSDGGACSSIFECICKQ